MSRLRFFLVGAALAIALHTGAWAAPGNVTLQQEHRGIHLMALAIDPDKTFDATLLSAKASLRNIAAALDWLIAKSPFSARQLERLKSSGRIVLIYKPGDLKNAYGGENVASFLPDFARSTDKRGRAKVYLVVVGRHGVKWPTDELAATLAHELVGHGIQHRRGRLSTIRNIDAECEAKLYEEIANQELGLDKRNPRMVAFRQSLEGRWCADFKAYMRKHRTGEVPLWNSLSPDIPKLLTAFEAYLQHSQSTGATAKAIDALKRQIRERRRRAMADASPKTLFNTGVRLRDGGIGIQPDPTEAFRYFRLSAENGYAQAWRNVATMYEKGIGTVRDIAEARKWYARAAGSTNTRVSDPLARGSDRY